MESRSLRRSTTSSECCAWGGLPTAHLALGGQDARVTIWDAEHGRCTQVDQRDWVNALSWAPDPMAPALAVAAGVDVALYRPDGGLVAELAFQPGTVNALAWAGEPPRLAAGCRGGVRWLGIAEGEQADAFPSAGAPLALLPDPGGRLLTAADLSGSLHLWDLRCEDHAELQGYPDPVELLAWDGPGSRLAAVAGDEITVWSVASDHDELVVGDQPVVLQGHDERITDIVFRPGGTLLASAGADGALVLWDPATTDNALGRLEFGVELSRCAWRPGTGTIAVGTATGRVGVVELWPGG